MAGLSQGPQSHADSQQTSTDQLSRSAQIQQNADQINQQRDSVAKRTRGVLDMSRKEIMQATEGMNTRELVQNAAAGDILSAARLRIDHCQFRGGNRRYTFTAARGTYAHEAIGLQHVCNRPDHKQVTRVRGDTIVTATKGADGKFYSNGGSGPMTIFENDDFFINKGRDEVEAIIRPNKKAQDQSRNSVDNPAKKLDVQKKNERGKQVHEKKVAEALKLYRQAKDPFERGYHAARLNVLRGNIPYAVRYLRGLLTTSKTHNAPKATMKKIRTLYEKAMKTAGPALAQHYQNQYQKLLATKPKNAVEKKKVEFDRDFMKANKELASGAYFESYKTLRYLVTIVGSTPTENYAKAKVMLRRVSLLLLDRAQSYINQMAAGISKLSNLQKYAGLRGKEAHIEAKLYLPALINLIRSGKATHIDDANDYILKKGGEVTVNGKKYDFGFLARKYISNDRSIVKMAMEVAGRKQGSRLHQRAMLALADRVGRDNEWYRVAAFGMSKNLYTSVLGHNPKSQRAMLAFAGHHIPGFKNGMIAFRKRLLKRKLPADKINRMVRSSITTAFVFTVLKNAVNVQGLAALNPNNLSALMSDTLKAEGITDPITQRAAQSMIQLYYAQAMTKGLDFVFKKLLEAIPIGRVTVMVKRGKKFVVAGKKVLKAKSVRDKKIGKMIKWVHDADSKLSAASGMSSALYKKGRAYFDRLRNRKKRKQNRQENAMIQGSQSVSMQQRLGASIVLG